jgi:hypothetical protein
VQPFLTAGHTHIRDFVLPSRVFRTKYSYAETANCTSFTNICIRLIFLLDHDDAGQNHNIKIHSKSFERVEEFKYLGTTQTNRNSIHEDIKSRLKSGNACYHSVQNLLSSTLLSKNTKTRAYRTIVLPVVLYWCETWSLTLREEQRLRVFENRVLRRILGPKRDEATGEWRRLHNEELNDLYSSPNINRVIKSRRMRWVWHVARLGEKRGAYRILVGRPEGRQPLGRPRRRWEDNIKMDLQEVGWGMD